MYTLNMDKHKGVKVIWNGKPMREIYPHATQWQMFKYKVRILLLRLVVISILVGSIYMAFIAGQSSQGVVIYTQPEIITMELKAPIMDRIADCETGDRLPNGKAVKGTARHYGKSGQVMMTGNNNKSVDVGKYAINTVWFKKATELGLDITKEQDNKKMAEWIYANRGTEDWYPSKSCWQ